MSPNRRPTGSFWRSIDARYLEPPEPFVLTMEALDALPVGESVQLLLFREPHPLYRVLEQHGFSRQTVARADGSFEILISKA